MLQSPLLTLLNAVIGGRVRFMIWAATFGAILALIPFVIFSSRHPWLHLMELGGENMLMLGFQGAIGIGAVYIFDPWLEWGRQIADNATTAPARRRLESERKPLVLDDHR